MSMNKTWPISNFTSEDCSDDMRFLLSQPRRLNESIPFDALLSPRPQLCKHCAASARRRSCRSSFRRGRSFKFPRRNNLLGERFEARLTAQVLKHRINPDRNDVIGGTLAIRSLQRIDGALLVA